MNNFYGKQELLTHFGREGQRALSEANVLIIGMGGLGCAVAQQLAVMGVGRLTLIDGDCVDSSNLSRQILYSPEDLAQSKVLAAQKTLKRLRPSFEVVAIDEYLNPETCEKYFSPAQVVVDATDNFAAKFLINAAGTKFLVPVVWANAQKWEGQVALFDARKGPCYACFVPESPRFPTGTCDEDGVLGVVPNIIGNLQALECVKIICEIAGVREAPKPQYGELQSYSFRDASFFKTKVPKNKECSVCSQQSSDIVLPVAAAPLCKSYPVFSWSELQAKSFRLVDLRERSEVGTSSVRNSILLPLSEIERDVPGAIERLNAAHYNALFCKSGKRSRRFFDLLSQQEVKSKNIVVLKENAEELMNCLTVSSGGANDS